MKILIISNLFPPQYLGGYELLCAQVCQTLFDWGHEITVLTSNEIVKEENMQEAYQFPIHRDLKLYLSFQKPAKLLRFARWKTGNYNYNITKQIIQKTQPDVIFVWSQLRLTLGAAKAAEKYSRRVVYTFNDEHISGFRAASWEFSLKGIIRYFLDHWLFSSVTLKGLQLENVTCISQLLKNNLITKKIPIHNAEIIYQGVEIDRFELKSLVGEIRTPLRLLYVGQLHAYKGVHNFVEAIQIIHESSPDLPLSASIVGGGPPEYIQELKEKAKKMNFVNFMGKVPHHELPKIYREHDIFVFPSIWEEPFGLTHLEAMASGTVVISTANGGQGEFLVDRENSLTFTQENSQELAEKILELAKSPSLAQDLAKNARKMVEEKFTVRGYVKNLEKFLEKHSHEDRSNT